MNRLYFKFYRILLNEKFYPFNIWISFIVGFLKNFLFCLIFNTFFLNYYTNSEFNEGVMFSFAFTLILMVFKIFTTFNPLQLIEFIYDTIEKITDIILIKVIGLFRK